MNEVTLKWWLNIKKIDVCRAAFSFQPLISPWVPAVPLTQDGEMLEVSQWAHVADIYPLLVGSKNGYCVHGITCLTICCACRLHYTMISTTKVQTAKHTLDLCHNKGNCTLFLFVVGCSRALMFLGNIHELSPDSRTVIRQIHHTWLTIGS
jgi:hypothetical protein